MTGSPTPFVPWWVPSDARQRLDFSELADDNEPVQRECRRLEAVLGAHVAAYRPGAKPRQTGLCSVFKFAGLTRLQADLIAASEERLGGVVFVVYARPLARW